MNIETLEQYYGIASNIEAIEEEIATLYNPVSSPNGHTEPRGTTPSNPTERNALRIIHLREQCEQERERMYQLLEEIEAWLLTVQDTEIVSIIRWKYLLRLDWKRVNMKVYGYPDYWYARKRLIRFFEKIDQNCQKV